MANIVDLKKVRAARKKAHSTAAAKAHRRFVPGRGSVFYGPLRQRLGAGVQILVFFGLFSWFMRSCSQ